MIFIKNRNQNIEQYLSSKGIGPIKRNGNELTYKCFFNNCHDGSKSKVPRLGIDTVKEQYNCFNCGEKGNIITLKKHFGDFTPYRTSPIKRKNFTQSLVKECAENIPNNIREYLNSRGVNDEIIQSKEIGYIEGVYGSNWITIPITMPESPEPDYFYLRKDPNNKNDDTPKNLSYPKGKGGVVLYGNLANENENLIITEGIMDCLSLLSLGYKAVTSTGGCNTFKDEWITTELLKAKNIYVAYDRDEAGEKGALKVLKMLKRAGYKNLFKVTLPDIVGDKGDVNDYIAKHRLPAEDLFTKYSEKYPIHIDISKFKELSLSDVEDVLSLTIKDDRVNKLITFLCYLSAFTEDNQFNIMFSAPSSSGKSYTALEVAKLFPEDSKLIISNCTANAFFHESGKYDKENNVIVIDLSRKILIFTENPDTQLLAKLRGFLSHDTKIHVSKITDKSEKGGNRTKTVHLVGYCSIVFCTATQKVDNQEQTRVITLSPEVTDNKIRAGINTVIERESGNSDFSKKINNNENRIHLIERLEAISNLKIKEIKIGGKNELYLKEKCFNIFGVLQPRHQRDIKKIIDIAKSLALLNAWFRDLQDNTITLNQKDIDDALSLYGPVAEVQNKNISPYVYDFYKDIIEPTYREANFNLISDEFPNGITYMDIAVAHHKIKGNTLDMSYLRYQILPQLEASGLIDKVKNGNRFEIHVTDFKVDNQINTRKLSEEIRESSENVCGVNK